ncbi:MAG: YkgJ family cysteine cluster protein [Rectinema sp.]|nr:YkgJ family cysteine cluster protein [Rectinema sp.]
MNEDFLSSPRYFSCTRCNRCCAGQPGFVWLSIRDLDRLCARFDMSRRAFASEFCKPVDLGVMITLSLKEKPNHDCIFLSACGCEAYEDRPIQCRTYPFWEHLVEDDQLWNEEAKECPGIGQGLRADPQYIIDAILLRRANPPLSIREIPDLVDLEKELRS